MWSKFCCKVWKLVTYFVFVLFCLFNCLFSSSGVYVSCGNRESTSRLVQIIQIWFNKKPNWYWGGEPVGYFTSVAEDLNLEQGKQIQLAVRVGLELAASRAGCRLLGNLVPRAFPSKNGWKALGTRLTPRANLRVNLIKLLQLYVLFSCLKTKATLRLVNYTCNSFI